MYTERSQANRNLRSNRVGNRGDNHSATLIPGIVPSRLWRVQAALGLTSLAFPRRRQSLWKALDSSRQLRDAFWPSLPDGVMVALLVLVQLV